MNKEEIDIQTIREAKSITLVKGIGDKDNKDFIITTYPILNAKDLIEKMERGLQLTGYFYKDDKEYPIITGFNSNNYRLITNEERVRKHEEALQVLKNSAFGISHNKPLGVDNN